MLIKNETRIYAAPAVEGLKEGICHFTKWQTLQYHGDEMAAR